MVFEGLQPPAQMEAVTAVMPSKEHLGLVPNKLGKAKQLQAWSL